MSARAAWGLAVAIAALCVAGCGGHRTLVDTSVRVPADPPPSPARWPRYPAFSSPSCWTRPFGSGRPLQAAPSLPVPSQPSSASPGEIVRKVLAGLGDRRYVLRVELGSPPPITLQHLRGYFAGARPPANARWAYIAVAHPQTMVSEWEAALVIGALRDDFCDALGPPLVGWTVNRGGIGLSDRTQAFEQWFPNPSPTAFRRRVRLVGRRYGFTVRELRLLRPRQLAPLLVVRTERNRKAFVHDVPAIMKLLDPIAPGHDATAVTFEGLLFEARDRHGAFVRVDDVYRGQTEGGEWSWNRCVYPYPHSEPVGAKPCPP